MNKASDLENAREPIMQRQDFDRIRKMAYEFCGVDLEGKEVLIATRLGKKVRELKLTSFERYCDHVQQDGSGEAFTAMIDALTTNHTSFFREARHFTFMHDDVLPVLPAEGPLRIWSAACSTGEEPYSIAFALVEALGEAAYRRLEITATDISTRVLRRAQQGVYPASSLAALANDMLRRCLLKGTGSYTGQCLVKREIRSLITFRQLNLLEDCSSVGPFQIIFCRNVMIYFDQPTQQTVVDHLVSRLVPGGYLFIGHAESLNLIKHPLKYISSAIYRKPGELSEGTPMRSAMLRAGSR